jgi:hypothetical protein
MGNSAKPRKPHRPKPVVKPLGMRNAALHELPPLQALEALGRDHFTEQHVYDLLSCADLVKRTAPADAPIREQAQEVVYAVAEIQRRSQRTGRPGATGDEITVLRNNIGKLIAFLRDVPNVAIYRATVAALAEFDKLGALRV